jgi:uncharacterized pyridoxal phosphate-containing UPF0001 family protein
MPILLEVLTSDEPTKSGLLPEESAEAMAEIRELAGVEVRGLMTMAPFTDETKRVRSAFVRLRELRDRLGGVEILPELSMGMSNDYEIAVEEGSTMVRIGSAIFAEEDG